MKTFILKLSNRKKIRKPKQVYFMCVVQAETVEESAQLIADAMGIKVSKKDLTVLSESKHAE